LTPTIIVGISKTLLVLVARSRTVVEGNTKRFFRSESVEKQCRGRTEPVRFEDNNARKLVTRPSAVFRTLLIAGEMGPEVFQSFEHKKKQGERRRVFPATSPAPTLDWLWSPHPRFPSRRNCQVVSEDLDFLKPPAGILRILAALL